VIAERHHAPQRTFAALLWRLLHWATGHDAFAIPLAAGALYAWGVRSVQRSVPY